MTRLIDQAAIPMARAYRPWVNISDVRQHLWAWAYSNESRVDSYFSEEYGDRIIRAILSREARNYVVKERAAVSGHSPEDVAWYTPSALRGILPDVFDYEDWQSFGGSGGGRSSNKPANESGDRLATIIDVKAGLEKLSKTTVALLREHYGRGASVEACAIGLGIEVDACRKRIQRAVIALSGKLNDPRPADPYEGVTLERWRENQRFYDTRTRGRNAMSNAKARSITDI